jgi:acyl-CoA-binding protein
MDDVQHVIALDINFDDLRVTINGQHEINAFMSACQQKNKSSIIVHLYNLFKEQNNGDEHDKKHGGKKRKTKSGGDGTKHIQIMKKIKSKKNVVDIDDFDIRCRLSQEQPVSENELKKLVENGLEFGLRFRYKQRLSAVVYDDKNAIIRFDLTKVQSFDAIKNYSKSVVSHEFEIELQPIVGSNGKIALSNKHLDQIFIESSKIIKMFQQSNFLITNTTKKMVLDKYAQIFDVDFRSNTLYGRQPVISVSKQRSRGIHFRNRSQYRL